MRGNVNASFVNITANAKIGLVVLNGFSAVSDTAIKADFAGLITKLTAASNANTAALNSFSQDLENALYAINASIALESAEAKAENATENSDFNKLKRLIETVTKERMGDCLQATLLSEMKGFTKVSIMATNCLDNITTLSNNFFAADKAVGVAWNTSYTVAWNAISACIGNSTTSALINALSTTKKQALDKCLKAVRNLL